MPFEALDTARATVSKKDVVVELGFRSLTPVFAM
jgi:hypothetical protein